MLDLRVSFKALVVAIEIKHFNLSLALNEILEGQAYNFLQVGIVGLSGNLLRSIVPIQSAPPKRTFKFHDIEHYT